MAATSNVEQQAHFPRKQLASLRVSFALTVTVGEPAIFMLQHLH
jgi:hypothetical protein